MNIFRRYMYWLHTQFPGGHVEKLPETDDRGQTNVPGVYVVGDLKGIPLLKFSLDSGTRTVRHIASDPAFISERDRDKSDLAIDLVIVGAGVAGMAAAIEAKKQGIKYELIEGSEPFSTITNFPKGKPIYTYPNEMKPEGDLQVTAQVKEELVKELKDQVREHSIRPKQALVKHVSREGKLIEVHLDQGEPIIARRVILALGRSGNFRQLGVPGEQLDKVYNRLHDPKDFCDKKVMVVGGGDSALEAAIALAQCGTHVTLSYRRPEFSRPKPENISKVRMLAVRISSEDMEEANVENPASERVGTAVSGYMREHMKEGSIRLMLSSQVKEIRSNEVVLKNSQGETERIPNDIVFAMTGREPPLKFFRSSRIRITGEWSKAAMATMALFTLFMVAMFNWKSGGWLYDFSQTNGIFPFNLKEIVDDADPKSWLGVLVSSASEPSFYYTLSYSLIVTIFGFKRIFKRKTPYITVQTLTLMLIQVIPLFILPEIVLPWLGRNGHLPEFIQTHLFPEGEYWRAYGFVLAWPLFVYNVFTSDPLWVWLGISVFQTCIFIPGLIYFFGKGSYCGWICSCGALAETLGDDHRHKMPHGSRWNRLNMAGQVILLIGIVMLALRVWGWAFSGSWPDTMFQSMLDGTGQAWYLKGLSYKWFVDIFLAGVIGYGFYFWYSGRVWCRFFCPLAALMHIYTRFSRFRIFAEKKKCISCNVCTSVCHQGIDVMNFANKGLPMNDPECVRCSACVQSCPTGVLSFGQLKSNGQQGASEWLSASPVRMNEHDAPELTLPQQPATPA